MHLIIVESPTKAKTLRKFLGKDYSVEASVGHIRDLPKSDLGVDIEHDFAPRYVIPTDKKKRVSELKDLAKKAETIVLATDPDREGEAIAWHIAEVLKDVKEAKKQKTKVKKKPEIVSPLSGTESVRFSRIVFHEITEDAILHALETPRQVDMRLVDAQQARRILDRLVGYKLSPLLWQKLSKRWLSAGRVQSVAVRLLVERDREIEKFAKSNYWRIMGMFTHPKTSSAPIPTELVGINGESVVTTTQHQLFDGTYTTKATTIVSQEQADTLVITAKTPYTVTSVDKRSSKRAPQPPYTTSTLQQDAGRRLGFSAKKTMQTAQRLYEEGIITYHRTDSLNLSQKFLSEARTYIDQTYGPQYVPASARTFTTKSKLAQEAHEAIRPTSVKRAPEKMDDYADFNRDHYRLYELIWKRALASQVNDAQFDATTITVDSANGLRFEGKGSVVTFDGYLRVTGRDQADDVLLPAVQTGDTLKAQSLTAEAHTTNPPPRYTEASLVKTLEEKDIGRPSTYAPILSTIIDRQYVTKEEKKLVPTELGKSVTDFLVLYFPEIMNLPFTATMEGSLDQIASGQRPWSPVIAEFYTAFEKDLQNSYDLAEKVKVVEEKLGEACPNCKGDLVIKAGRYGKFIACSNFPTCKYTHQYLEKINISCPNCGGEMVVKKTKRGKTFYGCSNYPTCTFAAWKKEDIKKTEAPAELKAAAVA